MSTPSDSRCEVYIAGVGASAGGLEALEELFHNMPEKTGIAFVVIQHLSPDFESHMPELLGRQTSIPIFPATDGAVVKPDTIYLIPPRKDMIISEGRLRLTDKDPKQGLTLPIDRFFRSLAHDAGRCAISIVLSGTGSDGTRGIQEIHDAGGLVLVQSEDSAKFDGMPHSAIATGVTDLVLAPAAMSAVLVQYVEQNLSREQLTEQNVRIPDDAGIEKILRLLRDEYEIDFSYYKTQTVMRRIERRLAMQQHGDVDLYADRLTSDDEELNELYRDLLIGVTKFFRDPEAFQHIEEKVLPQILKQTEGQEEIRCWVAGCATGEEVYSLAILLHEQLERAGRPINVKIFATDVHRESLEFGSRAVYSEEAVADVPPDFRDKYFQKKREGYYVVQAIRQMVVFAVHNVLTDAPFTRLDLVTCRNMLIYLLPNGQKTALSLFLFGLKTGSFLMLGPSESPGDLSEDFETLDKRWKIYRKLRDVPLNTQFPEGRNLPAITKPVHMPQIATRRGIGENKLFATYDRLLSRYLPAGFLVDPQLQLVHTFGDAGRFLEMKSGRHSSNLLDLIHPDLRMSLGGAVHHARKESRPVNFSGLKVRLPDQTSVYRLGVDTLADGKGQVEHFLVTLEPDVRPALPEAEEIDMSVEEVSRDQVVVLERELQSSRENLQSTIEELETSNEELQATNEELVASNEELQSTNEELHSVNEELYTVNAEYQKKIVELQELNEDLDNLLSSSELAVVFLDRELCIRRCTPQMAEHFHLLPRDIGRPLTAFAHHIDHPGLNDDLQRALKETVTIERPVADRFGTPYLLRIVPYRSSVKSNGVVMTLVDLSALKAQEEIARKWAAIAESTGDAIIGQDLSGRIVSWNAAAETMYGYSATEAIGRHIGQLILPDDGQKELASAIEAIRSGAPGRTLDTQRRAKDGRIVDVSVNLSAIREADKRISGVSSIDRDVTERRRAERQLAADHTVTQILAESQALDEAIPELLSALTRTLDVDVAEFWRKNEAGSLFLVDVEIAERASVRKLWRAKAEPRRYELGQGLPGRLWQERQALVIAGAENCALTSGRDEVQAADVRSIAGFPVQAGDEVFGIILLYSRRPFGENREVTKMLGGLGQEMGQFAQWARNEEKLRRLAEILERTDDLVATCDIDQRIQTLNPAGVRLLGIPSQEAVVSRPFSEFQPDWAHQRLLSEGLPTALQQGTWIGETAFTRADGTEIPVSQMLLVHRDHQGAVRYLSTVARNLVQQKQSEHELQDARAVAEKANAAKSVFLANMSHEVRTPMTAVIGLTDLLLESEADTSRRDMLDMILENGRYLTQLLNDILDLSKIEAGRLDIDRVPCSIVQLLEELRSLMQVRATRDNLEFGIEYRSRIPKVFPTDPIRTRQILSNLISNAIKFTEQGRVDILVEYEPRATDGELRIHVRDTGCGISADQQQTIFEPFSQVDRRLDRKAKGTGLGLSISRRLAEALGGRLSVRSELGQGSTFTVALPTPLVVESELIDGASAGIVVSAPPQVAGRSYNFSGRRILVAEDTHTNQFLIRRLLEQHGAEVDIVADGLQALASQQQSERDSRQFNLILMDMHMPHMTGYEAAQRLREAGYLGPIVALTASAMRGDRERCLAAGCTSYATKPIDRFSLLDELSRLLDDGSPVAAGS